MGKHRNIKSKNGAAYDFTACFLIALSHFSNFVLHIQYYRFFPDIVLVVGVLCVASVCLTVLLQIAPAIVRALIFATLIAIVLGDGLYEYGTASITGRLIGMTVTLCVALAIVFFLREHTTKVLIAAFCAILISTLVIGKFHAPAKMSVVAAPPPSGGKPLPIVVHLILDEHLGLAGMSSRLPGGEQIAREIQEFYLGAGFRLFSHAYSQYFETHSSLASALNFDPGGGSVQYLTSRRYGYALNRSSYLRRLENENYGINIYQSDYFDICSALRPKFRNCTTYRPENIDAEEIRGLDLAQRVRLIFNMYYSSFAIIKIARLLGRKLLRWSARTGITLPRIGLWHGRVGPIAAVPTFDRLVGDVAMSPGGTANVAHLLMPHYPYVYTPACTIRSPISSWGLRDPDNAAGGPESRRRLYRQYFDQLRCMMRKLKRLFDAMKKHRTFRDAIIVVHGDHGSRIGLADPVKSNIGALSADDFMDGFSTLFALKAPGVSPGLDGRMIPLPDLLAYSAVRDERLLRNYSNPTVYLTDDGSSYTEVRLPIFPPPGTK